MSYIHVKVTAGAKKESFKETKENYFTASVREKAEHNMANTRVLELVAGHFKVPVGKVKIVNGHKHPSKVLSVENELKMVKTRKN